ncbi:hypothetical protein BD770DRAFT_412435 [Pilaira anomala]|nr:hypothetical protein BD770DRAFT_412435 [Pilaira anomala]
MPATRASFQHMDKHYVCRPNLCCELLMGIYQQRLSNDKSILLAHEFLTMQNPMYASPQIPQMVTTSPYFSGPSPYMLPQQSSAYYPQMAAMQSTGPLNYVQTYQGPRDRGCCDCGCGACCLALEHY